MPRERIGYFQAYGNMWKRYADFRGRTTVAGFWKAYLFSAAVNFAYVVYSICNLSKIMDNIMGSILDLTGSYSGLYMDYFFGTIPFLIYFLATFVPTLALIVRRLRDSGQNPYWVIAFLLIPVAGYIMMIVMLQRPSAWIPNAAWTQSPYPQQPYGGAPYGQSAQPSYGQSARPPYSQPSPYGQDAPYAQQPQQSPSAQPSYGQSAQPPYSQPPPYGQDAPYAQQPQQSQPAQPPFGQPAQPPYRPSSNGEQGAPYSQYGQSPQPQGQQPQYGQGSQPQYGQPSGPQPQYGQYGQPYGYTQGAYAQYGQYNYAPQNRYGPPGYDKAMPAVVLCVILWIAAIIVYTSAYAYHMQNLFASIGGIGTNPYTDIFDNYDDWLDDYGDYYDDYGGYDEDDLYGYGEEDWTSGLTEEELMAVDFVRSGFVGGYADFTVEEVVAYHMYDLDWYIWDDGHGAYYVSVDGWSHADDEYVYAEFYLQEEEIAVYNISYREIDAYDEEAVQRYGDWYRAVGGEQGSLTDTNGAAA